MQTHRAIPERRLSVLDAASIIVGIVIGSGLYETTPEIARNVGSVAGLMSIWVVGGLMALAGALCYAELSTTYPQEGGDYAYLKRAYGQRVGFLYAWAQLWIVRPGSTGAMAFVFANYAHRLLPLSSASEAADLVIYAAGAVGLLTLINLAGLQQGKWTQNLLTGIKVAALLGVFVIAMIGPAAPTSAADTASGPDIGASGGVNWWLAFIFVMFTYGGWNDMSFVAAEVRQPERNLPAALILGTGTIVTVYLLANAAFVRMLGFEAVKSADALAADAFRARLGVPGARAISALVCVSCLGAINGMLLTGARVYYAVGRDHPLFARLAHWDTRRGTPTRSLLLQGAITLGVTLSIGLAGGEQGFERLVIFTAPVFWAFIVATGVSLFVLRLRDPAARRPYRVYLYPIIPIVFLLSALAVLYASAAYAAQEYLAEGLVTGLILAIGFGLSFLTRRN